MTVPNGSQCEHTSTETVELPTSSVSQRALHEAVGHLYDELAIATEREDTAQEPTTGDLFEALEQLYVGTAEESIETVEIRYERRE